jgi:peroxiredoxin
VNKILSVLLAIMALIAFSCKNRPNSVVEGKLRNSEKNSLKLEYLNINKTQLVDSIRLDKDGSFRFKLFIEQPGLYILKSENGKIINLLISPGEKVKIDGDYLELDKKYSIIGSPDSEFIRQLVEKLTDTRNQLKMLDGKYRNTPKLTELEANEYYIRRNDIIKDQRDFSISFIIDHLSSMASIYALYQKLSPEELVLNENRDIQYMKILADTLSVKYPGSDFVATFINDARSAEKRYKNLIGLQKKILEAQNGFPDISYPDPDGNLRSLGSLKGKTVLLYFWSVYSDATKQINPGIEKIYRKYKTKGFEVFGVCIDKTRDNWLKMIKFDELTFINTIGPDFPDSDAANAYNMRAVPTNYLLDKEGNIMARDLYGTELEKWLDNTL